MNKAMKKFVVQTIEFAVIKGIGPDDILKCLHHFGRDKFEYFNYAICVDLGKHVMACELLNQLFKQHLASLDVDELNDESRESILELISQDGIKRTSARMLSLRRKSYDEIEKELLEAIGTVDCQE